MSVGALYIVSVDNEVVVFFTCDSAVVVSEFEKSKAAVVIEISECICMDRIGMGSSRLACVACNNVVCLGRMCVNGFGEVVYGRRQSTQSVTTDASVIVHESTVDLVVVAT